MRPSPLRLTAAVGAAAAVLALSPSAFAANAIYGGRASSGEAIVIRADAKAQKLRSIIISWRAVCGDQSGFPNADTLTPVTAAPGFTPAPTELLVTRNAKGVFKGTQRGIMRNDHAEAAVEVTVDGKLKKTSARGTLAATVKVSDRETGADVTACDTGRVRWVAARAPGVVYGGTTSQGEPLVIRLNAKRKRVNDLLTTWYADCPAQGGFYRVPDSLGGFPVRSAGRFGAPWTVDVPMDDGNSMHVDYNLAGRIARASAKGTLQVKLTRTDAAGAATADCDSGGLSWKATTG